MRVLLINNVHNLSGGANTVYFNTGELLNSHGQEVVYFAMKTSHDEPCQYSDYFVEKSKKGVNISKMTSFVYNKDVISPLRRLIQDYHPDVAHLHLIYGGLTSAVIKVLVEERIPIVYTVHDYRLICPRITLLDRQNKLCRKCKDGHYYRCAINRCYKGSFIRSATLASEVYFREKFYNPLKYVDAFIFVSKFGKDKHFEFNSEYQNLYNEVLYNFLDKRIERLFNDSVDTYESYYLYYGRLAYEKGLETLIKGFAKFPKLHLKILGSGPMESKLQNLVNQLGANNITFISHKTGKELFDVVRRAKFVCMPSEWYEMLGMTIVEGNSFGVPSISSDIGGLGEIVEDHVTGFKFAQGDVDSLCSAIANASLLGEDEYNRMRNKAMQKCHELFDSEIHYKKLMEIYSNVIELKKK